MTQQLKHFSSLGIKTSAKGFIGDKIKFKKILDKKIIVHDFKIEDSKYEGKRLDLQIEVNETKYVTWTSSGYLMQAIQQVPKDAFPFITTVIQEESDCYQFT